MDENQVIEVGDNNFQREIVASEIPALVDFWGPTCGPCKALEPIIHDLAGTFGDRLKVARVNVNENTQTALQYAVKALPTILLFKQGKVVDQFTGRPSPEALQKFVQKVL